MGCEQESQAIRDFHLRGVEMAAAKDSDMLSAITKDVHNNVAIGDLRVEHGKEVEAAIRGKREACRVDR